MNVEAWLHVTTGPAAGTAEAFGASVGWLSNSPEDCSAAQGLNLPADVLNGIRPDLDQGYLVVAPRSAVRLKASEYLGRWRVHPATGDTLGMERSGRESMEAAIAAERAGLNAPRPTAEHIAAVKRMSELGERLSRLKFEDMESGGRFANDQPAGRYDPGLLMAPAPQVPGARMDTNQGPGVIQTDMDGTMPGGTSAPSPGSKTYAGVDGASSFYPITWPD